MVTESARPDEGTTSQVSAAPWWRFWRKPQYGVDVQEVAIRHHLRGHGGEALLCRECKEASRHAN